ncbi:DNA polymerase III subunit gamma/tau [Nitrospirillum viridazoti]|uniref:DNA polymerase III subunit gamma/tau n=1 Tax=Nitrospirillum viridazoti CBAmc TaxID=1441467 RepID=A0A248JTG7_9PROT|nr:DNA polymerase III subunit gamma/tau [Nitrospirillum amazonense]ASG21761.1 DNA polymerase III subunit gamma/tau [Nitrospirillum amazonense CBAmc]TWB27237.1 DNA polymerase-3 subunit gamma/tau [Nitrospirillum amazonense]
MTDQSPLSSASDSAAGNAVYRVLARKYRPRNFDELIGQDALVRTLRNAIQSGRIHQAYMLTGVRGVGKTTTARIIARALNCIGPDGQGGPTVSPCGVCEQCVSISQDRNVDVIEMDAASNTSVDNIREIIEGVRYAPAGARYKVYVIDEVHMLSRSAFNALLKTLEEPPPHVKFVFATTEIRKVPVTVLSRCQRFDLRRVDQGTLQAHFGRIAEQESVPVEAEALSLIARAADGSVRDGLSLLDQAIALGGGAVTGLQVRDMLGLADRTLVVDLFESTLSGKPADALAVLDDLHKRGADPVVIAQDLLDFTHFLTRARVVPGTAQDQGIPEMERVRGGELAAKLGMPALARAWQILLKGLGEVQQAPVPMQALEMVLIRLAYAADLPSPGDLVRKVMEGGVPAGSPTGGGGAPMGGGGNGGGAMARGMAMAGGGGSPNGAPMAVLRGGLAGAVKAAPVVAPAPVMEPVPDLPPADPKSFREVVELFGARREGMLQGNLLSMVHLVKFEPGLIELRPAAMAVPNLAGRVGQLLTEWTGRRWIVTVSSAPGEPTLSDQDRAAENRTREQAAANPLVQALMAAFPGTRMAAVRDLDQLAAAAAKAAAEEAALTPAFPSYGDGGMDAPDNPYFDAPPDMSDGDWEGDF